MAKMDCKYFLVLLLFHLFMGESSLVEEQNGVHRFKIDDDAIREAVHARRRRSVEEPVHVDSRPRARRSSDDKCESQEQAFLKKIETSESEFSHQFNFDNETKTTMSLSWVGENNAKILVVTTEEMFIFAKPSTLYRSSDDGKTFEDINHLVQGAYIRKDNGLQKDPNVPNRAFLVAHDISNDGGNDGNSILWITNDGGDSFKSAKLPFLLNGVLIFHPDKTKTDWILAEGQDMELYISVDGGQLWRKILSHAMAFKWTTHPKDDPQTIYATTDIDVTAQTRFPVSTGTKRLVKTTDLGSSWKEIVENVYSFGMQGKFLFVSRLQEGGTKRWMEVSTDSGKTFAETQLPTITSDRFYSILDMSEGLIFMHVDNPGDTGHGTLFTSDSTGIVFSESLQKHLYPNFMYGDVTDFYKVSSLRGVYISSQMDDDDSIHSMISFNRGGEWQPVRRPQDEPCKDESKACHLQIHNVYSVSHGVSANPPLSVPGAVGVAMVHAEVADALQRSVPDVYVTSDGGYNWIKGLTGPHHYQIADQGGLLVAIPANDTMPKLVKFSTDEGHCWHIYQFTEEDIIFTGLLTEPGNKAMSVAIWGYGMKDRRWKVHTIDFTKVIDRQCDDDDYESWVAHGDNSNDPRFQGCLLGRKETFRRLKKDSWCLNGHAREITSNQVNCECTKDDYDCDYGYMRNVGSSICKKDPDFQGKELDICLRGHEEEIVTEGYHKIPGDVCKGGFTPPGDKFTDLHKSCKEGDKSIVIEDMGDAAPVDFTSTHVHNRHIQSSIIAAVILIVLLIAVVLLGFIVRRYTVLQRQKISYRYNVLKADDCDNDYENDLRDAFSTSIYEEDNEEDHQDSHSRLAKGSIPASISVQADPIKIRQTPSGPLSVSADDPPEVAIVPSSSLPASNGAVPHKASAKKSAPKVKSYHDESDDDLLN